MIKLSQKVSESYVLVIHSIAFARFNCSYATPNPQHTNYFAIFYRSVVVRLVTCLLKHNIHCRVFVVQILSFCFYLINLGVPEYWREFWDRGFFFFFLFLLLLFFTKSYLNNYYHTTP